MADDAAAAAAAATAAVAAAMSAAGVNSDGSTGKAQHVKAPEWAGPDGFIQYEEEMSLWLFMTTLADNKKGGAMRVALTGAAYDTARTVPVETLITDQGHVELMKVLRLAFGGSDSKRGHSAYRKLKKTYRGNSSMETYLSAMTLVLAECNNNGYAISDKTAVSIILDQSGLDTNQQAATMSTAAMHVVKGLDEVAALNTAMSDLWGGDSTLAPSASAVMMCVTYGEHAAYMAARRTKPAAPGSAGGSSVHSAPKADPAGCWHCGKTGHVRRDCRKLAREKEQAAKTGDGDKRKDTHADETGYVSHETAHIVLVANEEEGKQLAAKAGDVILDIGATATIAGAAWIADYVAQLTPTERASIRSA